MALGGSFADIRVLALDTSTSCGWAHDPLDGLRMPMTGTWNLPGWKADVVDQSYVMLFNNIITAIAHAKITDVVIERPLSVYAHSGLDGKGWQGKGRKDPDLAEALLGFCAVAQTAARRMGCKPYVVAPSTVRKHFVGHGSPPDPKAAVMTRCRQLGWAFQGDDEADALATWDYGKSVLCPGWAWRSTLLGADQ